MRKTLSRTCAALCAALAICALAVAAPRAAAATISGTSVPEGSHTVLVAYFSAQGHTEAVAQEVAQATGGDTFELEPVEPYSTADLDWTDADSRVNREHDDASLRDVALVSTSVPDWDSYDVVFIGYPIWWGDYAWPTARFVTDNDFTGKTVVPFCTSSSSPIGSSDDNLAALTDTGTWIEGHRFPGGASQSAVDAWAEQIGAAQIPVEGVSIDPPSATIAVGESLQLSAIPLPANATGVTFTWSSGDESVATVSDSGLVTGVTAGVVVITVAAASDVSGTSDVTATPSQSPSPAVSVSPAASPSPSVSPSAGTATVDVARLYNPNSGEHLYTESDEERGILTAAGWRDEGVGWRAPSEGGTPVWRLYNPNAGDHHYTASEEERASLTEAGWRDEGIAFFAADEGGAPVRRLYNPNAVAGAHIFTTSEEERASLTEAGWRDEGTAWRVAR